MPGVGHHAGASGIKAKELLFPPNEKADKASVSEPCLPSIAEEEKTIIIPEPSNRPPGKYADTLEKYAKYTEALSGGYYHGNKVIIRVGDHTFYDNVPDGPDRAGLYVIAIFENEVLLRYHYNTYNSPGSCEWLMADFQKLPPGTFVVIAAKDDPTNNFNETGQTALRQIGAGNGLLGQKFRISYLCLGVKGLAQGEAIEKAGMELLKYAGPDVGRHIKFTFPKAPGIKGEFSKIYDSGIYGPQNWYINDHCFILGNDNTWHLFGILSTDPYKEIYGCNFAHAVAKSLTQTPWSKKPLALKTDPDSNEIHLWAPHVIFHNGLYYMYYCAGDKDPAKYKIHLAVSKNLKTWKRHSENPMIVDGFDARDPFILKVGNDWVMYYTATSNPTGGNHIVACQTSRDLIHWGNRKIVFKDPSQGKGGGPTESPVVVQRGQYYYLFIGPRNEYTGTDIFRSKNPFKWDINDRVGHISSHAAEVIRDTDGNWFISHCGRGRGGVYIAEFDWNDNLDDSDSSMPIPQKTGPPT
jgi:beta-fructofuranosidase